MKKVKLILAICAVAVMIASCEKEEDTVDPCDIVCKNGGTENSNCGCDCPLGFTGYNCETPVVPIVPDCQKNHTGTLVIENKSTSGNVYTAILNGQPLYTLSPNQSKSFPIGTGYYTLQFRIINSSFFSNVENLNINECFTYSYAWTY